MSLGLAIGRSWQIDWVASNWSLNGVGLVMRGVKWRSWICSGATGIE